MAALQRPDKSDREAVKKYSNQLYKDEQWKELCDYLEETLGGGSDGDLLWRYVRGAYRYGKHMMAAGDNKGAERVVDRAMERALKGLAENEQNFYLQKWTGVLLGLVGDIKGTKVRIENSYKVREHFEKAITIRPEESDLKHLLGRWCYQVASVSWLQRKAASAILATPPTSSYEEALSYFDAAEKDEPGFYQSNWLWLGKTCYQLNRKSEAKQWLRKMMDAPTVDIDDKESKLEAQQLLKKL